jgi:hypothetical protein
MTTTTIPATWPTEEIYEEAGKALANGYNHVEAIMYELGLILDPYMDGGKAPDVLPTAETVGLMWSFLEQLRIEAAQLQQNADALESNLQQTDSMRLAKAIRRAS